VRRLDPADAPASTTPASDGAARAAALFRIPRAHELFRSNASVLGFGALGALFIALMFVPSVTSTLRITSTLGISVTTVLLACVFAATVAYRLTGLSRLYFWLDVLEGVSAEAFVFFLVHASGSATNILWLFYLGHTLMTASVGTSRRNLAIISLGPAALAVAFGLEHDVVSALLSLLSGAMGATLYNVMGQTYDDLEASRLREAQLKVNLTQLRVAQERSRIARDLHDGVAADLAALAWRLRGRAAERAPGDETFEAEAEIVERRIESALRELREVVLGLRRAPVTWTDTLVSLRARCEELCSACALAFTVDGSPPDDPRLAGLGVDLQLVVVELVRNAVAHARPARVDVRIRAGDGVRVSVADDGAGFDGRAWRRSSGGLANVRRRVADLAGQIELFSSAAGTRVEIQLPGAGAAASPGRPAPVVLFDESG
jgi:signal transduction histidine kinase